MDIHKILSQDFKLNFLSHSHIDGVVFYNFVLSDLNGDNILELKDRFSNMREFYSRLKKVLPPGTLKRLPSFPDKLIILLLVEYRVNKR